MLTPGRPLLRLQHAPGARSLLIPLACPESLGATRIRNCESQCVQSFRASGLQSILIRVTPRDGQISSITIRIDRRMVMNLSGDPKPHHAFQGANLVRGHDRCFNPAHCPPAPA